MKTLVVSAMMFMLIGAVDALADEGGEAVVRWNETLLSVAEAEDSFLTLKGLRTAAMMHLAMHDALNAGGGQFETYANVDGRAADPLAAALNAAFTICAAQYPDEADRFRRLLNDTLPGEASEADAAFGAAVALQVLESRSDDGWDGQPEYRWHPMAPGVYAEFAEHSGTPEGFIFGAGWAHARGFALTSPDQYLSPPPPDIDSEAYASAFDEVRRLGRFQSMDRTPDQTHIALWWKDFVENSHNRLARDLAIREGLDAVAAARLFALLNTGIFDAYIASFANKFHYNHWRPYTAIRWANNDGNDATEADPTWDNTHRHTYAFPSYPSAHGTACAAAMTALTDTFGDQYAFVMYTPAVDVAGPFSGKIAMQPPTRDFGSFYEAARECAASRVFLGIHFRYDSDAGYELGREVGGNTVTGLLSPVHRGDEG